MPAPEIDEDPDYRTLPSVYESYPVRAPGMDQLRSARIIGPYLLTYARVRFDVAAGLLTVDQMRSLLSGRLSKSR